MLRQAMRLAVVLLLVTAYGLLASCGGPSIPPTSEPSIPPTSGPSIPPTNVDTRPTVKAKLTGTPQQLVAFDQALRPQLGDEPVACTVKVDGSISGCEVLQSSLVSSTLKDLTYGFYGPRTTMYEKLGVALNKVQLSPSALETSGDLTLELSEASLTPPDCSGKPLPCVATPWCPQYGGCSKQRWPCAKC
jgi:hypothetical protein